MLISPQASGKLDLDIGGGKTVTLTTEELKLGFEADNSAESNYAAQADGDVIVLLDSTLVLLPHAQPHTCSLAQPGHD